MLHCDSLTRINPNPDPTNNDDLGTRISSIAREKGQNMKKVAGGSACGYCGQHELESAPLALCLRCKLVSYCSKDCQAVHWRREPGGHKEFCLALEQRTPAAAQEANPKRFAADEDEFIICTADLDAEATMTLECSHRFHAKCIKLQKAVSDLKACPTCRGELKEQKPRKTPEMTLLAAIQLDRAMHGLELQGMLSWANLSESHQRAMDRIIKTLNREAGPDRNRQEAQLCLAVAYQNGEGIPRDYKLALQWYHKAAKQGHAEAQYQIGVMHKHGFGVKASPMEAKRCFRKAANKGNVNAPINAQKELEEM